MATLAIIGGTGLAQIQGLEIVKQQSIQTPYGDPSSEFIIGKLHDTDVVFLARHGNPHTIAPHKINYRANIHALKELGIEQIIAVAAVGGITAEMAPGRIIFPDQIIDYSYGREHTFFSENSGMVTHIDFTYPYSKVLREQLIHAATQSISDFTSHGVYACTQGPRLETAAEIQRLERDGCHLVGMTGMPEAALARELEIDYAACAVVANWAAGKTEGEISMPEIEKNLAMGMQNVLNIIHEFCKRAK